ncbi:MAG: phenylalanine--tRNA ligase subunit beta [bacterium]|nr:phenylalanine--tRNA ligase subunit beta [bacterium]
MKFSYVLLKKLAPRIESPKQLVEVLTAHAFEVEAADDKTIEIVIPANRYSDAASHFGMTKVVSAILNKKWSEPRPPKLNKKPRSKDFAIKITDKPLCSRYSGLYAEVSKIEPSPQWLQDILVACGLKPINNVVDVMNYVMLEVGQPLHAFDADLISGPINVRLSKRGERIVTIDLQSVACDGHQLLITDDKGPLALAGIKGGKRAEINSNTRRIIVEAANFNAASIYKTSRAVNIITDASLRFSHGLSPALVEKAIKRTADMLKKVCNAKVGSWLDIDNARHKAAIIKFDVDKFNNLTGLKLNQPTCLRYLKNLGFAVSGKLVKAPVERIDINIFEDLVEEIVNLYGYDKLPAIAPQIALIPSGMEDQLVLKDKIRNILIGLGMSEVYNYSFVNRQEALNDSKVWGGKPVSLRNPISSEFQYLRPSMYSQLLQNIKDNRRFYDEVRIFEIGKIFPEEGREILSLGLALGGSSKISSYFLELKGIAEALFQGLGLTDFEMEPYLDGLRVESDHKVIGFISGQVAEFDVDKLVALASAEKEYQPLSRYPSVIRDVSFLIDRVVRMSEAQNLIENSSHLLVDVDLVDWYEDDKTTQDRKSLTFRLVFQSEDRTLTDEEVGKEIEKIISSLQEKYGVEIR